MVGLASLIEHYPDMRNDPLNPGDSCHHLKAHKLALDASRFGSEVLTRRTVHA